MEIRDLTEDDLDAVLDARKRAFGPLSADSVAIWRKLVRPYLPQGRYLGAFDGTRLAGTARINPFTQWWHGRPVSMGGVASVTALPEDRGRGVGRRLMLAVTERCAELGHPISALYPSITRFYRGLGWEHAGGQLIATLPAEALRLIEPGEPVKLRRMGPDDAPELLSVLARVYAATRVSGPIAYDEGATRLWLEDDDDFGYLAEDGYVQYSWSDGDIRVDNLVAGSAATARALWSMVGSHATVAERVIAAVAPDDPVFWLIGNRPQDDVKKKRWMFRLIDVAAAVAARGFPAAVTAEAVVEVHDPQRPANSGAWRLEIASGAGTATRVGGTAGQGSVGSNVGSKAGPSMSIGGLSALYAGVPTTTLRQAGLLSGPAEADEALDAAFAARPYMLDFF